MPRYTTIYARLVALSAALVVLASCGTSGASAASTRLVTYAQGLTHASALALDNSNRLWVATAAYTDAGNDGVYLVAKAGATPVEAVKSLHTPLGLLWYHDELFVASKERVDAYGGLVGTTFAKHRTVLTLPSGVGEVNGIVLAPDGRMLLGISAPCDHCTPTSKDSGAIVSFRPDGTGLSADLQVYASGIRAPIGLAFAPNGDLLVTMNQRDDLGDDTPGDWLARVTEGSTWGFPDCYGQGGTACAGVPEPVAVLDKHAAVSGIAMKGSDAIVAEWATGKVVRVTADGDVSTYATGLKNPVPMLIGADGAVLVGDWATGTIFTVV